MRKLTMAESEMSVRVDVAACYRLMALYGLSDLTDGFVAARHPESPTSIVVGGYGLLPELAHASELHVRQFDRKPQLEKLGGVDTDAIEFSSAALGARSNINACIHAHTLAGIKLSSLNCDLLPISQWGIMYHGRVAFVPFTTIEVTSEACLREYSALFRAGNQAIILRNHGFLVAGQSVAHAFFTLHRLDQACALQLGAMQSGQDFVMPDIALAATLREQYWTMTRVDNDGRREWPGLLRKLDKLDNTFRH